MTDSSRSAGFPGSVPAPGIALVTLRPDPRHSHASLGLVLLSVQRPGEAPPHLRRAADAYPDDLILRARLGAALAQTGDVEAAQRRLAVVLERRPDHVAAPTAMGYTPTDARRPADAVAYFGRAGGRAPRASGARVGLVRAHLAAGNRAPAERELAVLRELDPRLAEQVQRR